MAKKKKKLRVAVIGCGERAKLHLAIAAADPEVRLVACCDIDKKRAKEAAAKYKIRAYTDFHKMVRRSLFRRRVDAVHICLPHHLHSGVANYCFAKGIHVLSEKPMATDLESAERAVRYAELTDKRYGVLFPQRSGAPATLVKEALLSGSLGKILSVRSVLAWSYPESYYTDSTWRGTWERSGGGVVIDRAIHQIDLVTWLVGSEVASASCSMANRSHPTVKVEDSAEGLITYQNGVQYSFYCMNNYVNDAPAEIHIACELGDVTLGYESATVEYHDGRRETARAASPDACVAEQIHQFYRACLGEEQLQMSGAAALATHRLVLSLYEAARERGIHLVGRENETVPPANGKLWNY